MQGIRRFVTWLVIYLKEARREMHKVNWPARRDVVRLTIVVLLFSASVAAILGAFDFLFSRAFLWILSEDSSTTQVSPDVSFGGEGNGESMPGQGLPIEVAPEEVPAETGE